MQSDEHRQKWNLMRTAADPGWSYGYAHYDTQGGVLYASGHSAWYGPAVWRSRGLGQTWNLSSEGITYGDDGPSVKRVWNLTPANGLLFAGVDPAGLFRSADGGETWSEVGTSLRSLPWYPQWVPGKGGLPVHSILPHPTDPQQLWLAVAGGGVLYTADGGKTWETRNALLKNGEPAWRVQRLVALPGKPEHLVQQNHAGVFLSTDGGLSWQNATGNLPTPFGFPVAAVAGDPFTIFAIPHHNQAGVRYIEGAKIAVWRSRDGGNSWTEQSRGLPQETAYTTVLRDGMDTDHLEQPGIYFGTSSGSVYGSIDGGDTWTLLAECLPEILSITSIVIKS